jgi:hypothetical protein
MIAKGERVVDPSKTTQQKKEGFFTYSILSTICTSNSWSKENFVYALMPWEK